ncbi:MAG: DnaB-like helicase C-terminal domain-containing protein, partial [Dehalococcoidia bacterium]|nr:DnaB-like helicase C-terminal domain-containing protein [Dehalococcoidia bacterium]
SWADGSPTLRAVSEYDRLNEAIDALGALARSVEAPVLAVVERNRAAMRTGGLSAGAGTRSIEYASGVVLGLDRVTEMPNANGETTIKVTIEKNRYGAPGRKIECAFHGARQFWREL